MDLSKSDVFKSARCAAAPYRTLAKQADAVGGTGDGPSRTRQANMGRPSIIRFRGTTPSAPHFGPPIRVAQKINPMAGPQNQ